MIVLVEGLDKVGKDTVIEAMKYYFGAYVVKAGPPANSSLLEEVKVKDRYRVLYKNAADNLPIMTLFNRSHLSQQVYSGVMRERDNLHDSTLKSFSSELATAPHIVLYLFNRNEAEMARRMGECREEYIQPCHRKDLHARYMEAIRASPMRYSLIDTTNHGTVKVLRACISAVEDSLARWNGWKK